MYASKQTKENEGQPPPDGIQFRNSTIFHAATIAAAFTHLKSEKCCFYHLSEPHLSLLVLCRSVPFKNAIFVTAVNNPSRVVLYVAESDVAVVNI